MIQLEHISAGYGQQQILRQLSLTLPEGKITTVIGPNGCGKTTLLKCISRFLPVQQGQILLEGQEIGRIERKAFARTVSILPQVRDVPVITAEAFVAHGRFPYLGFSRKLTGADRQKIENALADSGLLPLRGKLLGELSGGERQRAYFALILAQDTPYVLLDEPTTYLDIGQKYEMMELVKLLHRKGKTILMVLHDLPLAFSYSHHLIVMEKGRIVASGSPRSVLEQGIVEQVFHVTAQQVETVNGTEYLFLKKENRRS